jgi:hypothetical protein
MPPIAVYRVNFANGNLTPELDLLGWGPMVQSAAVAGKVESHSEPGGLHLSYTRQFQDPLGENRVHLPLPAMALPLPIRLFTRVSFDSPKGVTARFPTGVFAEVEPWAVALRVRFGSVGAAAGGVDGETHVTCQFRSTGVRLNTPMSLQRDAATVLDGPLNYNKYQGLWWILPPSRFQLEHAFCGIPTRVRPQDEFHVTGSGSLSLLGKQDHRVYSHKNFSGPTAAFIKELSVVLTMTEASFGRISARVRTFTLFLLTTTPGADVLLEDVVPT